MMKKLTKSGLSLLTRQQMKKLKAGVGDACSVTYQNASGTWVTESGVCKIKFEGGNMLTPGVAIPYCSTTSFSGPVTLSSNGGVSKCGHWFPAGQPWMSYFL
jgi:hypothetical protein